VIITFTEETMTAENTFIQKSEDVIVVSNPKTPAYQMRIVFKEELTIGEVEGDDNYMFGEYNGLSEQGVTLIGDLQWQDFHTICL